MSVIDTLIADRTQADVTRWGKLQEKEFSAMTAAEQAEWLSGPKGAYNPAKDMNRVEGAVSYLAQLLAGYGYIVTVAPKTDWAVGDEPTLAQLERYRADVAAIRGAIGTFNTTPATPTAMDKLTWQQANAIEQILLDVEAMIHLLEKTWFYSGEIYAGEV
ncbi:MAG: hypothetical protein AAGU32_01065 [Bacillota bacterium]